MYPQYPNYYNSQQYQMAQQQLVQQMAPQQMNIQNSNFVIVPSEEVARNYPVAPGNSVNFKNENAPYIYTKTMGFSQLDSPQFDRYKLIKEDEPEQPKQQDKDDIKYLTQDDLMELLDNYNDLKDLCNKLRSEVDTLKQQSSTKQITRTPKTIKEEK